tara:strand:+ start:7957 stop:8769 length:813 start_codon:yes stop_codon:yes gene_type:complete
VKKITLIGIVLIIVGCGSNQEDQFTAIYQSELCDKYSLYVNNKDVNGMLSLYTDDAIINGNASEQIIGKEAIKNEFIQWFENVDSIDHSATVISAKFFGNKAFVYGSWKLNQISKDGKKTNLRGNWMNHSEKIGNNWKMKIDLWNDSEFYELRDQNINYASTQDQTMLPENVSPDVYKVLVDNDYVKVLDVKFKSGQSDNMHHHNVFTAYVVNGGKMLNTYPDGSTSTMEIPNGMAVHRDFETVHQVKNIGDTDMHIILVEHKNIKPSPK